MFTLFDDALHRAALAVRDRHQSFMSGWSAAELAAHQLEQLRTTLRYVKTRSPFYRRHLENVDPDKVQSLAPDALATIPFTTKDDLRRELEGMLSKPMPEAWILYETTGTTGRATPCPRDNLDSINNNMVLTLYYRTIFEPLGKDQFVGVSGPNDLHATGDTFGDVCRNLGLAHGKMWPHAPTVGFDRTLELMRTIPVTGFFCTPGMALTLAKKAVAAGLDPKRDFKLKVLMLTGELASPALLANIGRLWGGTAYNALLASQEASVLGAAGLDGAMYIAPVINFYEIIEPGGDRAVTPNADGVLKGELVVTSLYQGSKPLVRYRTGDLVRLHAPRPGASLPAPTIEALGRTRDELLINGRNFNGYDLEQVLLEDVSGFIDYQIIIDKDGDDDRVTVQFELDPHSELTVPPTARERWSANVGAVELTTGPLGAVTSTGAMVSWKAARVVDRRQRAVDHERAASEAIAARRR